MRFAVVIVTYNRIEKLKHSLKCFDEQKTKPEYVIVVDNASTDGTREFLNEWKDGSDEYEKILITNEKNMGGSGGFYVGLEYARKLDVDWIYVSDDDAFVEENVIYEAKKYIESNENGNDISAICATVINNGEIDRTHRRMIVKKKLKLKFVDTERSQYDKNEFDIDLFSYVGTILNKSKLEQVGITEKDFFIWFDDTEHAIRLNKVGRIICIPSIRVHHDIETEEANTLNWKGYYGIRNSLYTYKYHFPKRFYRYEYFRIKARVLLKKILHRDLVRARLYDAAINDFRRGIKGLHTIYKPGWKPGQID